MLFAETYLVIDPAWPWSLPGFGWPALAVVAVVLMLLSVWTYAGVRGITRPRLLSILALRLGALIVACMLVLRPSLAREDEEAILPSKLIVFVDSSESMNINDGFNNWSRWENAQRILTAPAVVESLKTLSERHKVEIAYFQGAETVAKYDPQGQATGKRTEIGTWLHELWQTHGREPNLRGLVLFSDGADNGPRPALKEAVRWTGSPIYAFGLGKTNTSLNHRDLALVDIQPPQQPVPVKTQFTVTGKINAPGFVGSEALVSLWIENLSTGEMALAPGIERTGKDRGGKDRIVLRKENDNEVSITRDAPAQPGEYKITLKVDPMPDEVADTNNQISSYITVTKDGVSILWVEGHQRLESTFILRYALFKDRRFRVYPALKLNEGGKDDAIDWFQLDKQHYDVIVIGDISAQRFSNGRPDVFRRIKDKVTRDGTGLLLVGGHDAFANGWNVPLAADLTSLLPIQLTTPGQGSEPVRMLPTPTGLDHYLLRLADDPKENDKIWRSTFKPLDGITPLGTVKATAKPELAVGENGEAVLVATQSGEGRVLVFAGDTTYKAWRRSPEALPGFERFWKQTMLWLARQEMLEGNAWIKLDERRIPAGASKPLGFTVGLRGKGGIELKMDRVVVTVTGPGGDKTTIDPIKDRRGTIFNTMNAGEYRVEVNTEGKDVDGKKLVGSARARFLTYADNLENLRPAADHDFLTRLAQAGGGRFALGDEQTFLRFLDDLVTTKKTTEKPRVDLWPDWRRHPPSAIPGMAPTVHDQVRTLFVSGALPALVLFVAFLSLEWYLRRRWGLV